MVAPGPRRATTQAAPVARPVATAPAQAVAGAPKRSAMPMIAAVAVVLVVLLGGGAWFFLLRGSAPAPNTQTAQTATPTTAGTPAVAPSGAASPTAIPPAAPVQPAQTAPPVQTPPPAPQPGQSAQTQAVPPVTQPTVPPAQPAQSAADNTPPAPAPQVASAGLDTIRQQVAQLAASQRCAVVNGGVTDGGNVMLAGLAGTSAADALRQGLSGITNPGAVDWRISSLDPIFCPALDTLHPIVPAFGAAGPRLGLKLAEGRTRLSDGQHILPRLVMPDFRGSLRVDYVGHDGTVLHLYPQVADPSQHMTADPARVFQPGEAVNLGDPGPGHPAWEVGPPYGTDMIIAIASSQPLFERPRPSNVEQLADYMRDVQAAVEAAQRRNVRLTGSAMTVDTLAK